MAPYLWIFVGDLKKYKNWDPLIFIQWHHLKLKSKQNGFIKKQLGEDLDQIWVNF